MVPSVNILGSFFPAWLIVNALSYSLPQTSQGVIRASLRGVGTMPPLPRVAETFQAGHTPIRRGDRGLGRRPDLRRAVVEHAR